MPVSRSDPDSYLPLRPRVFALLMTLREGPAHGYRLLRALEERSETLRMDAGLMYRTIARLVGQGLVQRQCQQPAGEDARRKYYELTELGDAVLLAEAQRQTLLLEALAADHPRC